MFKPGDIIDHYRLTGELGAGAYGVVYTAVNTVSEQPAALKTVPLCGRAGQREQHALRLYRDLNHPNLLKLHHCGICGDFLYYTMDLAEGTLAAQHLKPDALLTAAIHLADALATLHAGGLLHRDVKPDNLFWRNGAPLLGDIGLVTGREGASLTGTPGFLPPGVRSGRVPLTEYADVYALAKSFYCLLSGKTVGDYPQYDGPFDPAAAQLLQTVLAVCDTPPVITSAAKFREALLAPPKRKKKHLWLIVLLAGLAAATVTASALFLHRSSTKTALPPGEIRPAARVSISGNPDYARMISAIRQAATEPGPAEKRALARQKAVWQELKKEAERQKELRYPHRKITSIDYEIRRDHFQKKFLQQAIQKRSGNDPEFRCFYTIANEVQELYQPLQILFDHPEYTENLKEDFLLWQKKYAKYCRERDRLLK